MTQPPSPSAAALETPLTQGDESPARPLPTGIPLSLGCVQDGMCRASPCICESESRKHIVAPAEIDRGWHIALDHQGKLVPVGRGLACGGWWWCPSAVNNNVDTLPEGWLIIVSFREAAERAIQLPSPSASALRPCPFCGEAVQRRDALWPSEGDSDAVIHAEPSDCPLQVFSDGTWGGGLYGRWNGGLDSTLERAVAAERETSTTLDAETLVKHRLAAFVTEILHGDESHRQWLWDAANAFLAGEPIPKAAERAKPAASDIEQQAHEVAEALNLIIGQQYGFDHSMPYSSWQYGVIRKKVAAALAERGRAGWREAAIAWTVCASIHREYAKGKDALFTTRQGDFVKHAEDARTAAIRNQTLTGD